MLALDHRHPRTPTSPAQHCVVIVENDGPLASALVARLQSEVASVVSVRLAALTEPITEVAPDIIVLDTGAPCDSATGLRPSEATYRQDSNALTFYVTGDTSYNLHQRGVANGVLLREWRSVEDIFDLVIDALTV